MASIATKACALVRSALHGKEDRVSFQEGGFQGTEVALDYYSLSLLSTVLPSTRMVPASSPTA